MPPLRQRLPAGRGCGRSRPAGRNDQPRTDCDFHRIRSRIHHLAFTGGVPLVFTGIKCVGRFDVTLGLAWGITTNAILLDALRLALTQGAVKLCRPC